MRAQARLPVSQLHLEHARHLFFSERSRRESIRGSLSTPLRLILLSLLLQAVAFLILPFHRAG